MKPDAAELRRLADALEDDPPSREAIAAAAFELRCLAEVQPIPEQPKTEQPQDHLSAPSGEPVRGGTGRDALLLATCTPEDLPTYHAFVFGRVRIWFNGLSDNNEYRSRWSRTTWWKAMWYPHRGDPSSSGAWGVYAGSDGHTGPGDAELTHWLPMPAGPSA